MATPSFISSFSECFQTTKTQEEEEEEQEAYQRYKDCVSTLPVEKGWGTIPLRKYKDFWIPEVFLQGLMASADYFRPRATDVLLASYPKSGTAWLKALAFATIHRDKDYPISQHPLLHRFIHDCVAQLEDLFGIGRIPDLNVLPSPQLLATHSPYSMLPESVKTSDCKIVYVCREPKDTLISMWHFMDAMRVETSEPISLDKAFELFCSGASRFGPIWDHQLEYWHQSLRRPQKVLFLKYEDMKAEPASSLRKLAEFIDRPFSEEEVMEGVVDEIVKLCSFEKLSNLDANKEGVRRQEEGLFVLKKSSFFRKGEVGDWKNNLTPQMAQKLDAITQQKFSASGLNFRS